MVTQQQIAEKLGVSRQLVTLALAGYPQVSEASRKRILAASKKMGYRPNPHALALGNKRTGMIALWIPDFISNHYIHLAREVNRMVRLAKNELIISEVGTTEVEQIVTHVPVDGILAVDAPQQVEAFRKLSISKTIPLVSIGADCPRGVDYVQVDLRAGTNEVMKHLIERGHRRIAHATFVSKDSPTHGSRRLAYAEAMKTAGLEPEYITYPLEEEQRSVVRELIKEHVRSKGHPDAIFCHSDDVALGIYRGLCDLKLRVPEDVVLVGCDGIEDTEYLESPLTTLTQPVREMCEQAMNFLLKRLEEPTTPRQSIVLSPQLVIRESSTR